MTRIQFTRTREDDASERRTLQVKAAGKTKEHAAIRALTHDQLRREMGAKA